VGFKYARLLGTFGAVLMLVLEAIFYFSADKISAMSVIRIIGFPITRIAARLFSGFPLNWKTEVLFDLYLVTCLAAEGFVVGLCVDLAGAKSRRATTPIR